MLRFLVPLSRRSPALRPKTLSPRLSTTFIPFRQPYGSQSNDDKLWNGATVKQASNEAGINITENALKQLKYIAERDNDPTQLLRIMVDSGGCHGFQNKMELTNTTDEDDIIFEKDGVRVVVDGISLQYLRGSNVDFVEELIGSTFQVVDNPNAKNSCGCNISFDIDLDMITQN
ncbi:uncharacterized protein BX664DRAFT_292931 [Halteromyces radiatus]|uniref:uncharacterized protein n=1 Tax=Halteromyces radiatus TaxID=101107 RepID=UPI00221EFF98|nr:uncharacterized protein BX664DRAFT_292931 [Halteromyces radiatus]KAI8097415.1 hypothetical protein BX664DRAFT_292931 [Halteromyces radiatus]